MLTVMDMSTGKIIPNDADPYGAEFGRFKDQVLNAEWVPMRPELQLRLQSVSNQEVPPKRLLPNINADAFLDSMYKNQR